MNSLSLARCMWSLIAASLITSRAVAAEVDARPPDRIALSTNGARLVDIDDGGGGSLNWLHYFTPDAIFGIGVEHQFIADSRWTFGSLRGSLSRGQPASRFSIYGEGHYGQGDENGRDFDYAVGVLGLSQNLTTKLSVQLEGRQIEIDRTHGNLPKLALTYLLTPRLLANVSYAHSIGGNLGTELITARVDHYGQHANLIIGGATGTADPSVVNLQPGLALPAQDLQQGFVGIGKTFARGEIQLLGDYLQLAQSEKITLTLSFTAYIGSRGRAR